MRSLPESWTPEPLATIDARLDAICTDLDVAMPWAIESGSRAWGFPSPDSDFDCRFLFVRPPEQLLTPWPPRDVIELPVEGDLDINGWELGKALKLLLKGNAVVIEWLRSPLVYRGEAWFHDALFGFARDFARRELVARHYLHLGERQRRVYFGDGKDVPQKKIFYALRPAATLRWLRLHPGQAIAPMHFPTLIAECDPPTAVADLAAELIARKSLSRELGAEPLPTPIALFMDQEFALARAEFEGARATVSQQAREEAERLYRAAVERCRDRPPLIPPGLGKATRPATPQT